MDLFDHITDDDGRLTMCGVWVRNLPRAPLCPLCVAVEKRHQERSGPRPWIQVGATGAESAGRIR